MQNFVLFVRRASDVPRHMKKHDPSAKFVLLLSSYYQQQDELDASVLLSRVPGTSALLITLFPNSLIVIDAYFKGNSRAFEKL